MKNLKSTMALNSMLITLLVSILSFVACQKESTISHSEADPQAATETMSVINEKQVDFSTKDGVKVHFTKDAQDTISVKSEGQIFEGVKSVKVSGNNGTITDQEFVSWLAATVIEEIKTAKDYSTSGSSEHIARRKNKKCGCTIVIVVVVVVVVHH